VIGLHLAIIFTRRCCNAKVSSSTLCACFDVVLIDNHQVTLLFGRVMVIGGQPTNEPIYGWMDGWMVGR